MYEWIPMEFDFAFEIESGIVRNFYVRAHSSSRKYFTIYLPDGEIGNNSYPITSLMHRMEDNHGTINGMTLEEITGICHDDEIDISKLI